MSNINPQDKLTKALRAYGSIDTSLESDNLEFADHIRSRVRKRRRNRAVAVSSLSSVATIFIVITVLFNINMNGINVNENELDLWLTEVNYDQAMEYVISEVNLESIETNFLDEKESWIIDILENEKLDDMYTTLDNADVSDQELFLEQLENMQIM